MLARLLHVRVCATNGLIDFVVYNLPAGVGATRWPVFVALGLLETATMYGRHLLYYPSAAARGPRNRSRR